MLTKVLVAMGVAMAGLFAAERVSADQYVQGYYRQNGSYVQPHYRSNADGNFHNNWSTYPNINPYTGRTGSNRYPSYTLAARGRIAVTPRPTEATTEAGSRRNEKTHEASD